MGSSSKAWMVAASIGAVEVLKDQWGLCRWNYGIRVLQQHAKNHLRSHSQPKKPSAPPLSSSAAVVRGNTAAEERKSRRSEEALMKVMYLSCWGPN